MWVEIKSAWRIVNCSAIVGIGDDIDYRWSERPLWHVMFIIKVTKNREGTLQIDNFIA